MARKYVGPGVPVPEGGGVESVDELRSDGLSAFDQIYVRNGAFFGRTSTTIGSFIDGYPVGLIPGNPRTDINREDDSVDFNAFRFYEQGTWTPGLVGVTRHQSSGGNIPGFGSTFNYDPGFKTESGRYVLMGHVCYVEGVIEYDATVDPPTFDFDSVNESLIIDGLPFARADKLPSFSETGGLLGEGLLQAHAVHSNTASPLNSVTAAEIGVMPFYEPGVTLTNNIPFIELRAPGSNNNVLDETGALGQGNTWTIRIFGWYLVSPNTFGPLSTGELTVPSEVSGE